MGRRLDAGNPNPRNVGSDFGWLGIRLWDVLAARDARNRHHQARLQEMCDWRNAVAHHDFASTALAGRRRVRASDLAAWRASCDALALELDQAMRLYLSVTTGHVPWQEAAR